jgi:hypothetical protein
MPVTFWTPVGILFKQAENEKAGAGDRNYSGGVESHNDIGWAGKIVRRSGRKTSSRSGLV